MEFEHKKISFTAWIVAHGRTLTDIPYAREIFDRLKKLAESNHEIVPTEQELRAPVAPYFEARYKMTNIALANSGITQVLELAAGFSPRGLQLTADPEFKVVQFDLPEILTEMRLISEEIMASHKLNRPNLFFAAGNVLDSEALKKTLQHFDQSKPIAVVNEGLLRYLTFEEKEKVARNIHQLLEQVGGVWITPDIQTKDVINFDRTTKIAQRVGRDIFANYFKDNQHAKEFFEDLGFKVEQRDMEEVAEKLTSLEQLGRTLSEAKTEMRHRMLFVMRLN